MRIRVDPDKCQGHNRCKAIAPELFALDRFGNTSAVGEGRVPPGFEEKARLAAANWGRRKFLVGLPISRR